MAVNPFEEEVNAALSVTPGVTPDRGLASGVQTDQGYIDAVVDQVERESNQQAITDTAFTYGNPPPEDAEFDASTFAKEHGVTEERAAELLKIYSPEDAGAVLYAEKTSVINPRVVAWGAKKENYPYYSKHAGTLLEFAKADTGPDFVDDVQQALYRNVPMLENLLAVGLYSTGAVDKQSFAGMLKNIDDRRAGFTPYGTDMSGWEAAQEEWKADKEKVPQGINEIAGMPKETYEDYIKMWFRGSQISGAISLDMMEYAWAALNNKKAVFLQGLESTGSTLGPTALAIGAQFLPVGGVPGLFVKAGVGIGGMTMVRYAEAVNEEMQEYRQEDGSIDYMAILDDEEKMQRINDIALKYGVVGGSLDYLLNLFGGTLAANTVKQKAIRAGFDVASEGIAEGGATVTKEMTKGADFGEALGEGLYKGLEESILVTPTKGTLSAIGGIPRVAGVFMEKVRVAKHEANTAVKREEKVQRVKELKKKVKEAVKTDKDAKKFEELIDEVIKPDEVTEYEKNKAEEGEDSKLDKEAKVEPETKVEPDSISNLWVVTDAIKSVLDKESYNLFLERLKPETRKAIEEGEQNGINVAKISLAEWLTATRDLDEGIDEHIFTNEDELKSYLKQQLKPKAKTKPKEEDKKEAEKEQKPEPKVEEGQADKVAFSRFKNAEEENVFNEIKSELKETFKRNKVIPTKVKSEMQEEYASVFFNYLRRRSEMTGKPISLLKMERTHIWAKKSGRFIGWNSPNFLTLFSTQYLKDGWAEKAGVKADVRQGWVTGMTSKGDVVTLLHELAHGILNDMAADWDHIHSIEESKLTPQQKDYKEAMKYMTEWLGLKDLKGIFIVKNKIHPLHEKVAVTSEKFFFEGKFKGVKAAKALYKLQQLMRSLYPPSRIGTGYAHKGVHASSITGDLNKMFTNALGLGEAIETEVYPLIPEFPFSEELLGEDYIRLRDMYREAVDTVLAKYYADLVAQEGKANTKKLPKDIEKIVEKKAMEKAKNEYWFKLHHFWELQPDKKINFSSLNTDHLLTISKSVHKNRIDTDNKSYDLQYFIDLGLVDSENYLANIGHALLYEAMIAEIRYDILRQYNPNISELEQFKANANGRLVNDKILNKVRQEASEIALQALRDQQGLDPSAVNVFDNFQIFKEGIDEEAKQTALNTPTGISMDQAGRAKKKRRFLSSPLVLEDKFIKGHLGTLKVNITYLEEQFKRHIKDKNFVEALDIYGHIQIQRKAQEHIDQMQRKIVDVNRKWRQFSRNEVRNKPVTILVKTLDNQYLILTMAYGEFKLSKDPTKLSSKDKIIDPTDNPINSDIVETVKNNMFPEKMNFPSYRNLMAETAFKNMIMEAYPEFFVPIERKMSIDEVKEHFDSIGDVSPIAQEENAIVKAHAKWKMSLKPIVDAILNEVKPVGGTIQQRKLPQNRLLKYFTVDAVAMYNHLASFMDEKTWAKSWLNRLFHKVLEQESLRQVELQKALTKISKMARKMAIKESALAKGMGVKDSTDMKKGVVNFLLSQISGLTSAPIQAVELGEGVAFKNLSEVLVALMYTNSESGSQKFFQGGFFSSNNKKTGPIDKAAWDAFIKRLVDTGVLTRAHFDFIQEIHDQFEKIYPMVHKSFMDVEGQNIGQVKGQSRTISFPDGQKATYKGGYYPLIKNNKFPGSESLITGQETDRDKNFDIWYPAVDISMGKKRSQGRYPLELNLGRIFSLMGHHYSNAYLKRSLRAVDVVMRDKRISERLEERQEGFYDRILKPWLNRTVKQQYARYDDSTFGQLATGFRRHVYVYLFFGNVKSMAKQTLGWIQAVPTIAQYVGKGKLAKHVLSTAGVIRNPRLYREMRDKIGEVSPFMKNRMDNFQENLVRGLDELKVTETKLERLKASSVKWSFLGIQIAQNFVDMAVWKAAYEKQIEEGQTEGQAIAYADGLVERTQAGSTVSSMTNAQFKTPFERLAYMITMVAHGLRGQLHEVRSRAKDKGEHYNLKTLHAILYFSVIPTLIQYGVGYALAAMTGDEEEEEKYLGYTEADIMGDIVYETMDIYSPLLSRFAAPVFVPGSGEYMGMGPVYYPLRKATGGAQAVQDAMFDEDFEEFSGRDYDNMATAATLLTGIPFAPIGKAVRAAEEE